MKLAFLLNNFYPYGGLEKNFLRIVNACIENGHSVTIFTMSWAGEKISGVEIILLPGAGMTNHSRALSFVRQLQRKIGPRDFDLVIGFNRLPGLDLYYAADVCYLLDIARRRSFLSRITPRYRVYAGFEKSVFGRDAATHIMYLSEAEKKNYISVYDTPEERFHYLPPGIDKKRIRDELSEQSRRQVRGELGLKDEQFMLLMVGSDFRRKGVSRAISSVSALPGDLREKVELFIIGKGKDKSFKRQALKSGIGERVHFLGGRPDVPRFLAAADLFLHPAVTENTGNVILESMVAGVPVLATEICGYAFHINKADCGVVVPEPFKQEKMNELLSQMLLVENLETLGKNGFSYADSTDLYSRPLAAVKIIESVAEKKKTGAK